MPFQDPGQGDLPPPYEPGSKPSVRPGGGPPGGGPGGGPVINPGTPFGGIGGLDPNVFRLLSSLGEQVPIMVKRRGLGPMPGVNPGPPGRTDTVPAMLSPGEVVMNNGVTQNPQLLAALLQLNQHGAQQMQGGGQPVSQAPQGYEHGGMVMGKCPHCGGDCSPQGYAFGGFVGGFPGMRQQQPRPAAPPQPGAFGGYTYDPSGSASNFNPADPWGGLQANHNPYAFGAAQRGLGGFGAAGYFDPRGNQMLLNAMNEGAQGTADALVRRQTTAADLSGLDPAQRAAAKLQALRDTGRGVQDIMANTRAQALGNQNDFAQNLFNQLFQQNAGWYGAQQQGDITRWLQNQQNQDAKKNYWGNLAGGVLGAGVGGYFGGKP